jgi:hypothetical protein
MLFSKQDVYTKQDDSAFISIAERNVAWIKIGK